MPCGCRLNSSHVRLPIPNCIQVIQDTQLIQICGNKPKVLKTWQPMSVCKDLEEKISEGICHEKKLLQFKSSQGVIKFGIQHMLENQGYRNFQNVESFEK